MPYSVERGGGYPHYKYSVKHVSRLQLLKKIKKKLQNIRSWERADYIGKRRLKRGARGKEEQRRTKSGKSEQVNKSTLEWGMTMGEDTKEAPKESSPGLLQG